MNWMRVLNGLAVLFLLLLIFLIWHGSDGKTLAFLAAAVCLFFGNLDRIKSLKASLFGFEAETREVIQTARDTIGELRLIAKDFSHLLVLFLHGEGRFGGAMSEDEKQAFEIKLLQNLREIGLDETQITEVREAGRPYVLFDYASFIIRGLHDRAMSRLRPPCCRACVSRRSGSGHPFRALS